MEEKNDGNEERSGFGLTVPATLVSIFSGAVAFANAPKPQMDTVESLSLALLVAAGTYLGAKIGKHVGFDLGALTGGVAGGIFTGGMGAAIGGLTAEKGKKAETAVAGALMGGTFGSLAGAMLIAVCGYCAGFIGGAHIGHVLSRDASMKYIFNKPAAAPTQSINLPMLKSAPELIASFRP